MLLTATLLVGLAVAQRGGGRGGGGGGGRGGRGGDDSDDGAQVPEVGCCYGADDRCDTDSQSMCERLAARRGCEWRSGISDCTFVAPSPTGCCFSATQNSRCDVDDQAACEQGARRADCEWRDGDAADLCAHVPTAEPTTGPRPSALHCIISDHFDVLCSEQAHPRQHPRWERSRVAPSPTARTPICAAPGT